MAVNWQSKGREARAVHFVNGEHFREAITALSADGFDLDVFADPSRSNFREVRKLLSGGVPKTSERVRDGARVLFTQLAEMREIVGASAFRSCDFGLAILNPLYVAPVTKVFEGGGLSTSYGTEADEYLFAGQASLTGNLWIGGRVEPTPQALGQMAVTLQYNERI